MLPLKDEEANIKQILFVVLVFGLAQFVPDVGNGASQQNWE